MSGNFKIALLQMHVVGGDRTCNLNHAEELLARAANHGANLILLPEAMDLGWTHPSCLLEAEPIPSGANCRRLQRLANVDPVSRPARGAAWEGHWQADTDKFAK